MSKRAKNDDHRPKKTGTACVKRLTSFGEIQNPTPEDIESLIASARMRDATLAALVRSTISEYVAMHGDANQIAAMRKIIEV